MRQVKIILNVDEGCVVPSVDSVVVVDNGKGWRGEPAQAAEMIAKIDESMHLVAIEITNMLASFERTKRQIERIEAKESKLTPEQIGNWRVALVALFGPYALLIQAGDIEEMKRVMSRRTAEDYVPVSEEND